MTMLNVSNLSIKAGNFLVKDINFSVGEAEYFVLMGKTGSGKSLLLKSICGLIFHEGGQIVLNDNDITDIEPRFRQIGYVPQGSDLFPHLSVVDNILFSMKIHRKSRNEQKDYLDEIAPKLQIEHLIGRDTLRLSGGEKQKVSLARALALRPKLLLLDEPVSALDEASRREICQVLKTIQRDFRVACIHVCHNQQEARQMADRIGVMHQGELLQIGTLDEIKNNPAKEQVRKLFDQPID